LQRVDNYLGKVERKVNGTRARSELLEGRLEGGEGLKKKRSLDRLVRKSSLTKMSGGRGGASEERALRYVLGLFNGHEGRGMEKRWQCWNTLLILRGKKKKKS
jgi:hypothetical protein